MIRPTTVLVIEDDAAMRHGLVDNLEIEGYGVYGAGTAREGREIALRRRPDLVLLDVMLPDGDGIELCRRLRMQGFEPPIILLTARGQELDKVVGLESGADDYVVKPFSLRELLARIHAHLRRRDKRDGATGPVRIGSAEVDFASHQVFRDGQALDASSKELELLEFLYRRRGQVVSRDAVLTEVWGRSDDVVTRSVDNFILRLRKKIEPDPARPRYLITVHGTGYKLVETL